MESIRADTVPEQVRYRFGLKWVLVLTLMLSVAFAWIAAQNYRVTRQSQVLNDLAQIGVRVRWREPTGLALLTRKVLGQRDARLMRRVNENWLSQPRDLVTWTATDQQVSVLIERIKHLDSVRELHVEQSPLTEHGIEILKSELPTVAVLTHADLINRGPVQTQARFATAAIELLAIVAGGLLCIGITLVWPFARWRKNRRLSRTKAVRH